MKKSVISGKIILLICTAVFLYACQANPNTGEVKVRGALMEIMHNGDVAGKVSLDSLKEYDHLYALGALEGLKGEVQIFNGQAYLSSVSNGKIIIDRSFNQKAALLVYTAVAKWIAADIKEHINSMEELESFISETASSLGFDIDEPIPFRITGQASTLKWHVIDWKEGDTDHTPEKHRNSGLKGTLHDVGVDIIGFYSTKHQGVFTHQSSNMHMHFMTDDKKLAGHLDEIKLGSSMVLKLPDRN